MKIQPITPQMLRSQPDQTCFVINQLIAQVNALTAKAEQGESSS